jgi:hypothetical protein
VDPIRFLHGGIPPFHAPVRDGKRGLLFRSRSGTVKNGLSNDASETVTAVRTHLFPPQKQYNIYFPLDSTGNQSHWCGKNPQSFENHRGHSNYIKIPAGKINLYPPATPPALLRADP